ncbi:hypothetical protein ECG_01682 [Echinococcus granulosus]|uniref:Expressed conserved protein n=1 Tax=Echinococcus granulosus TaxID=6210 RepID=A0A068WAG1_ECHGR|nr:hypothetical protein ECG_01682 [Echinococcus granulosus]CDS15374.1 expressed conserved protein [Echinococcus granulosus]
MSVSDLLIGQSVLSSSQKTLLMIKFLHFFLYNTGQFPDFRLLSNKDDVSKSTASLLMSTRKLQSSINSVLLLEMELCSLSTFPIEQFLFILGPNVQKPLRMVLLNFRNCNFAPEDDIGSPEEQRFQGFFKGLMESPYFNAIFEPTPPTRLHVYFKTDRRFRYDDFVPKLSFNPPIGSIHVLNVLSTEDTMDLYPGGSDVATDEESGMQLLLDAEIVSYISLYSLTCQLVDAYAYANRMRVYTIAYY